MHFYFSPKSTTNECRVFCVMFCALQCFTSRSYTFFVLFGGWRNVEARCATQHTMAKRQSVRFFGRLLELENDEIFVRRKIVVVVVAVVVELILNMTYTRITETATATATLSSTSTTSTKRQHNAP